MCGLAGVLAPSGGAASRELVTAMTRSLVHRGPDAEGFFFAGRIGLGYRRLSFVDLAHGIEPLFNEDRTIALICNGEIYNFVELREELRSRGHAFATGSDCEVIVHLYEEEGPAAFSRLEGMFAIALWDGRRSELFLARDPFGVKPLYFAHSGGRLIFASELKALLSDDGLSRSIDPSALFSYLTSLSVLDPSCILAGVKKVPPATFIRFPSDAPPVVERFWSPPKAEDRPNWSESEIVDQIRRALDDSVRISLRSDVPVGLFLSGGVDSSSLAAAVRRTGAPLAGAFCLGFEDASFDESDDAAAIATHLGLEFSTVKMAAREAVPLVEELAAGLDEPFGDASAIPTLMVSRFARRSVKAVLSGEGADELFGGNFWHRKGYRAHGALPYGDGIAFSSSSLEKIGDALLPAPTDPDADHGGAAGQDAARRDLTTYLPSDLLFKMDRVPMMAGLEVRVPFLNRRVAELALRIPWRHKEKDGSGKAVLKKSLEGFVPATAMTRPKRGFSVPLDSWLWQEGPFRDLVRETLSSTRANRGFVARREIQRMFDEHDRFQAMHGYRLWLLFMLEMWCRNVLDRRPGPDATGPRPGSAPK